MTPTQHDDAEPTVLRIPISSPPPGPSLNQLPSDYLSGASGEETVRDGASGSKRGSPSLNGRAGASNRMSNNGERVRAGERMRAGESKLEQ